MAGVRYTAVELAAETGVSTRSIQSWVTDGILPRAEGVGWGGATRYYTDLHRRRIVEILHLKDGNMTHADIYDRLNPLEDEDE